MNLSGQLDKTKPHRDQDGYLAVLIKYRRHRFCRICALFMKGDRKKLEAHFRGHHKGEEPAFLKSEEEPQEPMYSNWHEYRLSLASKLQVMPEVRVLLSG